MIKIIPRELIKHLEWTPDQQLPQKPQVNPTSQPVQQRTASIDALINSGREFYSEQKDSKGNYIGVAVALQEAMKQRGSDAIIATMPYLVAGKAQADKNNYLWKKWFTAFSEENAGIDKNGKLVRKGQGIVLTVHGGGILTTERIKQAYREGLTPQYAAKYTDTEFATLLNGVLPSGESIDLYTVDDVKNGIPDPFGRYAVWMPAETAKSRSSGYHVKSDFMKNELVMARVGTLEHLDAYFEKAQHPPNQNLGNWHRFGEIDFQQPQGRLLFVLNTNNGLNGNLNLNLGGRFVGVVAPEAHRQ
ncbi:hypothetical protein HYS49_02960 [Candidatus Woesearchaeota archaeon]|nr:hypothetical protein [Candidatus Woesearchaeota archaeon]